MKMVDFDLMDMNRAAIVVTQLDDVFTSGFVVSDDNEKVILFHDVHEAREYFYSNNGAIMNGVKQCYDSYNADDCKFCEGTYIVTIFDYAKHCTVPTEEYNWGDIVFDSFAINVSFKISCELAN